MELGGSLTHSQKSTTCPYPSQINPFLFPAHFWQAQLVSFLVGLRTYQHPCRIYVIAESRLCVAISRAELSLLAYFRFANRVPQHIWRATWMVQFNLSSYWLVGSCSEKMSYILFWERFFSVVWKVQIVGTYISRKKTRRWHILTRATDDNYVTFSNNVKLKMIVWVDRNS